MKKISLFRIITAASIILASISSVTAASLSPTSSVSPSSFQLNTSTLTNLKPTQTSGVLLGCSGVKNSQFRGIGANYSDVFVDWTIKHNLGTSYFLVNVKDDKGKLDENYSGSGGGIASPYSIPSIRYPFYDKDQYMTINLTVTAYDNQSQLKSKVTCQVTMTNDFNRPQTLFAPSNSFSILGSPTSGASSSSSSSGSSSDTLVIPGIRQIGDGGSSGTSSDSGTSSSSSGQSSSGTTGSTTGSTSGSGGTSSSGSQSATGGTSSGQTSGATVAEEPPLLPSPDILTCKGSAKTLYYENDEPAYDRMGTTCFLLLPSIVSAKIYTDAYDPKAEDNSGEEIKTLLMDSVKEKGRFGVTWDGFDDYDQVTPTGKYKLVVSAKPASNFKPDISIHSFMAENVPEGFFDEKTTEDSAPATGSTNATSNNELHGAAVSSTDEDPVVEESSPEVAGPEREASKCPTVFYPVDIEDSPYKTLIRKAYDECLVKGYPDGTFRPEQGLTRAEASKIVMLGSGRVAWQGCYDNDCGSPFMDLDMWQGPWVRAAYEAKVVSGVSKDRFEPNRNILRAEAVALANKAFGIPLHQGCYDPDCGAGYPDDVFTDVTQMWQGPYLRAASDKKIIQTVTPCRFYPDSPITRGQFIEIIFRAQNSQ